MLARVLARAVQQRAADGVAGPVDAWTSDPGLAVRPTLARVARRILQRQPEQDMIADPEDFLAKKVVSLTFPEGIGLRTPDLVLDAKAFVAALGSFGRHWFKLVPNPVRTKPGRDAYILTPAIEKYVEAFPDNPACVPLVGNAHLPAVEAEGAYLRAAYVPYLTRKATDPDTDIGHVDVRTRRVEGEFSPDFVFTAAMNGCAFTVTGAASEDSFTAWHYQSPASNREEASAFRRERSPTDWFGVEEYDSGDHTGFFEVTNIMWRPPASDDWKVLSQEVDTSTTDPGAAEIRAFRSRTLRLTPGAELEHTRRIYKAFAKTQEYELGRLHVNLRARDVSEAEREFLVKLEAAVSTQLAADVLLLDNATDFTSLAAAARRIKEGRSNQHDAIWILAGTVRALTDKRLAEDLKKFGWRQNADLQRSLRDRLERLDQLVALYRRVTWLDELVAEATD